LRAKRSNPETSPQNWIASSLSLACTLTSAALFQPALMGEPRHPKGDDAHGRVDAVAAKSS